MAFLSTPCALIDEKKFAFKGELSSNSREIDYRLMDFTTADWISLSAAIIAALAGLTGFLTAVAARKQAQDATEAASKAQMEATRIATQAAQLQALDWVDQFFAGVRDWSEEVVDSISQCIHLPEVQDVSLREQLWSQARAALSAHCDRGRWFFPNKYHKQYGTQKEPAYCGVRQRILDHVLEAYKAAETCPGFADRSKHNNLVACQRAFVSEVQAVLNPRHREAQIATILERFGIADQMRKSTDNESTHRPEPA